jgi:hypothetical protein
MLLLNLTLFGINFILNLCKMFWDKNLFTFSNKVCNQFSNLFQTSFLFSPKKNAARKRTKEALSEKKRARSKEVQPEPSS